jgi:hypothetical protein
MQQVLMRVLTAVVTPPTVIHPVATVRIRLIAKRHFKYNWCDNHKPHSTRYAQLKQRHYDKRQHKHAVYNDNQQSYC